MSVYAIDSFPAQDFGLELAARQSRPADSCVLDALLLLWLMARRESHLLAEINGLKDLARSLEADVVAAEAERDAAKKLYRAWC